MTRGEAIEIIECGDISNRWGKDGEEVEKMAIKALEQEPGWIPVSERLPDDRKRCLVTFEAEHVDIMYYAQDLYRVDKYDFCDKKDKAGWYDYDSEWGYHSRDDVIAWLPLPGPYKAESEEG